MFWGIRSVHPRMYLNNNCNFHFPIITIKICTIGIVILCLHCILTIVYWVVWDVYVLFSVIRFWCLPLCNSMQKKSAISVKYMQARISFKKKIVRIIERHMDKKRKTIDTDWHRISLRWHLTTTSLQKYANKIKPINDI